MEERDLEMAEKMVEQERESSMAAVRSSLAAEYHEDFDGVNCMDCPNPVGEERLRMMRIRCFECQTIREKKISRGIFVEPNQFRPRERLALPELIEKSTAQISPDSGVLVTGAKTPAKKRAAKPKSTD